MRFIHVGALLAFSACIGNAFNDGPVVGESLEAPAAEPVLSPGSEEPVDASTLTKGPVTLRIPDEGPEGPDTENIWVINSTDRVFSTALRPAKASTAIRLHAARGEYEAGQILLRSTVDQTGVHLVATALTSTSGARIPASGISIRREYNHPRIVLTAGDPERPPNGGTAFYDALVENVPTSVPARTTQPYFFQVWVPRDQEPGIYSGSVTVKSSTGDVTLPVRVTVYPVTLPPTRESTFKANNWFTSAGWDYAFTAQAIPLQFGVQQFDDNWWKVMGNIAKNLARHRNNVIYADFQGLLLPDTRIDATGKYEFGWQTFDRFIQLFIDAGALQYIYTPTLLEPPDGRLEMLKNVGGKLERVLTPANTPESNAYLDALFPALKAHLDAKGWTSIFYMSALDEPRSTAETESARWFYAKYRQTFPNALTNEAHFKLSPENEVDLTTLTPMESVYGTNVGHYQKGRLSGKDLWLYYCGNITRLGDVNRVIGYEISRSRLTPWLIWKIGGTGFLHWGWNYWATGSTAPVADTFDDAQTGDNFIVRPNKAAFDVYDSLRSEALTDGQEDFELLSQLARTRPALARSIVDSLIVSSNVYERSGEEIHVRHRQLLLALSSKGNDAALPYGDDFAQDASAWRTTNGDWSLAGGTYSQRANATWAVSTAALQGRAYSDVAVSVDVQISAVHAQGGNSNWAGVIVRAIEGTVSDAGYLVAVRNNGELFVYRTGTTLGAAMIPGYAAGQTVRLRVVANGEILRVYAGPSLVLTVTDAAYPIGAVSLATGGTAAVFDNLTVNPLINPAEGAIVTTSSTFDADGFAATALVDGQKTSSGSTKGWSSQTAANAAAAEWVSVDLGAPRAVGRVDLHPRTDELGNGFPADFTVELSADGATWTPVATRENLPQPNGLVSVTFPSRIARHVKVIANRLRADSTGAFRFQLAELQVAGGNFAAGRPVTTSSSVEGVEGWRRAHLTDGAVFSQRGYSMGWSSAEGDVSRAEWAVVDLEALTRIQQVILHPRSDGINTGRGLPHTVLIEVSDDAQTWASMPVVLDSAGPGPGLAQSIRFEPTTARYVRVSAERLSKEPNGRFALQLAELEVR